MLTARPRLPKDEPLRWHGVGSLSPAPPGTRTLTPALDTQGHSTPEPSGGPSSRVHSYCAPSAWKGALLHLHVADARDLCRGELESRVQAGQGCTGPSLRARPAQGEASALSPHASCPSGQAWERGPPTPACLAPAPCLPSHPVSTAPRKLAPPRRCKPTIQPAVGTAAASRGTDRGRQEGGGDEWALLGAPSHPGSTRGLASHPEAARGRDPLRPPTGAGAGTQASERGREDEARETGGQGRPRQECGCRGQGTHGLSREGQAT